MPTRTLASVRRRAAGAVLGLGATLLALTLGRPAAPGAPSGTAAPGGDDRAAVCPALRTAAPAPGPVGDGCSVLPAVRAALARADVPAEPELETLRATVTRGLGEPGCFAALAGELAHVTDCGIVYDAVAIRLVADPAHVAETAAALAQPATCQWKLAAALREVPHVEPALAAALADLTRSPREEVRGSAWLTLGTVTRLARNEGQRDLAACLDDLLADALVAPLTNEEHDLQVRAAGNAGCVACRTTLHAAARAADVRERRGAVSALRFLASSDDVAALCRALGEDGEPSVRGAAAFALRHASTARETRLGCLAAAAAYDVSEAVAREAVTSLADLAGGDDPERLGIGALVHVARASRHAATRAHAAEALRTFASDEAIAAALATR